MLHGMAKHIETPLLRGFRMDTLDGRKEARKFAKSRSAEWKPRRALSPVVLEQVVG